MICYVCSSSSVRRLFSRNLRVNRESQNRDSLPSRRWLPRNFVFNTPLIFFSESKPRVQAVSRKVRCLSRRLESNALFLPSLDTRIFGKTTFRKPLIRSDNRKNANLVRLFQRDIHET